MKLATRAITVIVIRRSVFVFPCADTRRPPHFATYPSPVPLCTLRSTQVVEGNVDAAAADVEDEEGVEDAEEAHGDGDDGDHA